MGTKGDLRKILKTELASISDQEYFDLSQKVSGHLSNLLINLGVIQKKLVVGVFAPIEKEPKWFLRMDENLKELTAYPAIVGGEMIYRLAQMGELKVSRDFGVEILGPGDTGPEVTPEVVIVPGLAFTSKGERLGRGKGFYDRYLGKKPAIKIGIAFEMQIKKEIPIETHDELMDFVVTDHEIYKINR